MDSIHSQGHNTPVDYYKIKAISNSSLGFVNPLQGGSGTKFASFIEGKLKLESKSLDLGSIIHTALLEPEKFSVEGSELTELGSRLCDLLIENYDSIHDIDIQGLTRFALEAGYSQPSYAITYFRGDKFRNEFARRLDLKRLNPDTRFFNKDEIHLIGACVDSIKSDTRAMDILDAAGNEYEKEFFTWSAQGLPIKGKIDCLNRDMNYVADIKTTYKGCSEFMWTSFLQYRYWRQMSFYLHLLKRNNVSIEKFYFIVVSTKDCETLTLEFSVDDIFVTYGNWEIRNLLHIIDFYEHFGYGNIENDLKIKPGSNIILENNLTNNLTYLSEIGKKAYEYQQGVGEASFSIFQDRKIPKFSE